MDKTQKPLQLLEQLEELNSFSGNPAEFLQNLISTKRFVIEGAGSAIIKFRPNQPPAILAISPLSQNNKLPEWLAKAIKSLSASKESLKSFKCQKFGSEKNGFTPYLIIMPLKPGSIDDGVEVYHLLVKQVNELEHKVRQLQLLNPYYTFFEERIRLKDSHAQAERLYRIFNLIMTFNASFDNFLGFLMTMTNELASCWNCSRVSVGVLYGRHIKLRSLSNTENFNRKTDLVRDLEGVMEECADQSLEIVAPQTGAGTYVCRKADTYAQKYGPLSVLSLPIRYNHKVLAVVTLERPVDNTFSDDEIKTFRMLLDLTSPSFDYLLDQSRWFGARLYQSFVKKASYFLGARYTVAKLLILFVFALGIWLTVATGTYEVEGTFRFDSENNYIISAPFNGEIEKVFVQSGQMVKKGDELLRLDTTELQLRLNNLVAQKIESLKQATLALRENKPAEEQIARAQADSIQSEIKLTEYSINKAIVRATMDGMVFGDDLEKLPFSVIELGKPIMNILDPDSLYANLYIGEDQIADITLDQGGELAAVGYPNRKIPFEITKVEKVSRLVAQKNVYQCEAVLSEKEEWIRHGMEGVAHVNAGERKLVWIWMRKAVNWIRMKLWF